MKKCSKCGETKDRGCFYADKRSADGLRGKCKVCMGAEVAVWRANNVCRARELSRNWRERNPEKCRDACAKYNADHRDERCEYARQRRLANPEEACERVRLWRERNPEKVREYPRRFYEANRDKARERSRCWRDAHLDEARDRARRWREENPDKVTENNRNWRKRNPDKVAQRSVLRRACEQQATPLWADKEKIAEVYAQRDQLTAESGVQFHVDHIIPLKSKLVCGLHVHNNLQVISARDNQKKHNSFKGDSGCRIS